jgi:transcription termination factor Rho
MNLRDIKNKSIADLIDLSQSLGLEDVRRARKQELIFSILKLYLEKGKDIYGEGILEILQDGYGFLRSSNTSYFASPNDIYVSPTFIRKFNLRVGDSILGKIRPPKDSERYFSIKHINSINFDLPNIARTKILFENLTPEYAKERLSMEIGNGSTIDITARVIDLASPFGKGQRGLIVAPPKTGKTIMMQNIACSIAKKYPECYLIVLLIDERPEEVTEMKRSVRGEVVASTFDEPASRHVQLAEIVIEKAKRLVEHKQDVVILLDSITRLARAYNTISPASGRVLSGGVEANALQKPKRFFGSARNTAEGGSLTIVATALVETGSKMDEVIFEEFKGTGNMELHLNRKIAEKRIYPAVSFGRSGTRREELLTTRQEQQKLWILRRILHEMEDVQAMDFLIEKLKKTDTNEILFSIMKGG